MNKAGLTIVGDSPQPSYYTPIPNLAIQQLEVYAFKLLAVLMDIARKSARCWLSNKDLAQRIGCSVNRMKKARDVLVASGYISVQDGTATERAVITILFGNIWKTNHEAYAHKSTEGLSPDDRGVSPNDNPLSSDDTLTKQYRENKKEKEKEPHAPSARPAIQEIKIQSVHSQQMDTIALDTTALPISALDNKTLNKQARAIIATYLRVSKVVKSNAYAIWTQDAKDLVQRGIDNKQVARFVTEKQKEDFFKDKSVTWNVVTSQIIAWAEAYTRAQQKAAQPDLHEQWGVTEDDYMLPNLYDSPFDLKFYPDDKKAG